MGAVKRMDFGVKRCSGSCILVKGIVKDGPVSDGADSYSFVWVAEETKNSMCDMACRL
jgi:hypothetical protein